MDIKLKERWYLIKNNYCIYKHTNLINGKVYIGQTCQLPEKRFGKNGNGYKGCRYFYNAIECYGWNNFKHEILENNLSHEKADILEQQYIKKYKSNNPDYGYNLEGGGTYSKIDATRKNEYEDEIMKYWSYPKKIAQYDLTGNIIKVWKNTKTASDELGISFSSITDCCSGNKKRAGRYVFRYIINNELHVKIDGLFIIGQYSLDGKFIKVWDFVSDIEDELGIKSDYVLDCCNGKRNKVNDFIFNKIYDSKNIPQRINPYKVYNRFDKNENYIDSFYSLNEIKNKLNINPYNISRCVSGKLKSYKGYIWKLE